MSNPPTQPNPTLTAFTDALLAGLVALLLFGPLTGLVLDGYRLNTFWERPWLLAGAVFLGRLVMGLVSTSSSGRAWLHRWGRLHQQGAYVANHARRHYLAAAATVALALLLPFVLSSYWLNVAILCLIYVLLGLGLNIVVGLAGLLDLGFVAFYAVGAYGYALGNLYLGLDFWAALPLAALLAASFGVVLGFPVLRMHGDYLAIVTLGFGEIIRLILNNWISFTGGPNGVRAPFPTLFGLEFTRRATQGGVPFHEVFGLPYASHVRYLFLYLLLLLAVGIMVLFVTRLKRMPLGRAWEALREDEIACRALGINHVTVKLSAFAMGAMVGGVGGVFFAAFQGFVSPSSFTFFESALILAVVVLGGMGSTVGVIAAALLLTALPEILREFSDYRVLVFGLAMVGMMVWRPRGLLRLRRPWFALPGAAP